MNNYLSKVTQCVLILLVLVSCQEQDLETIEVVDEAAITLEHDYLKFKDFEALENYVDSHIEFSETDLVDHENSLGFTSMKSYFRLASEHEADHQQSMASGNVSGEIHSQFVLAHPQRFQYDEDQHIALNTFWYDAAVAINPDGFVRVGGVLYQYSRKEVKAIAINGAKDIRSRYELFAAAKVNGINENGVAKSEVETVVLQEEGGRYSFNGSCSTNQFPGNKTLTGTVTFSNTPTWSNVYDASCNCFRLYVSRYMSVIDASISVRVPNPLGSGTISTFATKRMSGNYARNGNQTFNFTETSSINMDRTILRVFGITATPGVSAPALNIPNFFANMQDVSGFPNYGCFVQWF